MVQRSFSARLDQHPWRMEQEKEQIQTPFPAVGIPRSLHPYISSPSSSWSSNSCTPP